MQESNKEKKRRVVVTGTGVIAPNGIGRTAFWQNTLRGISGITRMDFAKRHRLKSTIGAPVKNFCAEKENVSHLDRYIQFAVSATQMAVTESGIDFSTLNKERVGVSIANAIGGTARMEQEFLQATQQGTAELDANLVSRNLFRAATFNSATMEIANRYHIEGPCCTIPTGCAAGLDAIGFSLDLIRSGKVDVMLTGASEAPLTPMVMAAFDAIGALSSKYNDRPESASRPYDATRDGFVLGESCGILLLEERQHALARGATILAEIAGYGSTCNAYHMTGLPEDGLDLARAILLAIADAGISAEAIDYINSHGSSTPQNDANETAAFKQVFGKHAYRIPVSSLKSMCGHALSAANAIETIAAIYSIQSQKIHPTLNYRHADKNCDLDYVPSLCRDHRIRYALKNASGFSGIHSALVLAYA